MDSPSVFEIHFLELGYPPDMAVRFQARITFAMVHIMTIESNTVKGFEQLCAISEHASLSGVKQVNIILIGCFCQDWIVSRGLAQQAGACGLAQPA